MEAKYTILMPVYNRFEFLKLAINSVLNQTFKNFQLIIYNDGSNKPVSPFITKKLGINDDRIKIIENVKNGGLVNARNGLLDACTTKWACWLDSDDACSIYRLAYIDAFLKRQSKFTWIWTHWVPFNGNGTTNYKIKPMVGKAKNHYVPNAGF